VTEYKEKKLLNNYMQFVYDSVIQVYKNIVPDNYVEALKMNQQLLQIIQ
jgi:hypothetical protein